MESLDVVDGSLERCALIRREGILRASKFLLGYGEALESNAVKAFRVRTERSVAVPADRVDHLECDSSNVGARLLCGPRQNRAAISVSQTVPVEDSHRSGLTGEAGGTRGA